MNATSENTTVHPHRRGEHRPVPAAHLARSGSSPQAWGTLTSGPQPPRRFRFIPTGVGNTPRLAMPFLAIPVHPHRRGEHVLKADLEKQVTGSSPQAWGTHLFCPRRNRRRRFIPTGVGNTPFLPAIAGLIPVHPHRRGEHGVFRAEEFNSIGSSPQAWGTRRTRGRRRFLCRFIPTGVGNTAMSPFSLSSLAVHPHRRGEHFSSS